MSKKTPPLNRETLLDYLSQHYPHPSKRQIADEFKIKGDERIELKKLLGILKSEGLYQPKASEKLSAVLWLEILPPDADGQLMARPAKPKQHGSHLPIYVDTSQHAPEIGSKILARLRFHTDHYRAIILKMMTRPASEEGANSLLGIIEKYQGKFYFVAIERGVRLDFLLPEAISKNYQLRDGHLVKIYLKSDIARGYQDSYRAPNINSVTIIAHKRDPHALSLLALAKHDITPEFPEHIREESESLKPILLHTEDSLRKDLTHLPFVTIDGETAKDFDDAVYGAHDKQTNKAILYVAIADVSHYVKPNSALDNEARDRANSVYLPDMAVPMLPERLSNNLCSLIEGEQRPVMVAEMKIDDEGFTVGADFYPAMIKSRARLTYEQVQDALDNHHCKTKPELLPALQSLYQIYRALLKRREARGALDLERAEYKIQFDEKFYPLAVAEQTRLESHRLIEEMMIAANVAVAKFLHSKGQECIYRVHDMPSAIKGEELRLQAIGLGLSMPKKMGNRPQDYQQLLNRAKGKDFYPILCDATLKCQSQATYSYDNIGHFGLALDSYCHFTSPIRRYSDLIVHRNLSYLFSKAQKQKEEPTNESRKKIRKMKELDNQQLTEHLSTYERRAQKCEYSAFDYYAALLMQDKIGETVSGVIGHVSGSGLFIRIDGENIEGFMPARFITPASSRYGRDRALAHLQRQFTLLQPINAIIDDVDVLRAQITLKPLKTIAPASRQRPVKKSKYKKSRKKSS